MGLCVSNTALIIPHYHKDRALNIYDIDKAIGEWNRKPDQIILFNNSGVTLGLHNFQEILSPINFGSSIRYSIAAACGADIIVCHDDDLIIPEESFWELADFIEKNPDSVVGFCGANLSDGDRPYLDRQSFSIECQRDTASGVDVVIGRVTAFHKQALPMYFHFISKLDYSLWKNHEDIPLSISNEWSGGGNYILGINVQNLSEEGVGLSHDPKHYEHRDTLVKACLAIA